MNAIAYFLNRSRAKAASSLIRRAVCERQAREWVKRRFGPWR